MKMGGSLERQSRGGERSIYYDVWDLARYGL